jgi:phosphatidate cytidylyltransferase
LLKQRVVTAIFLLAFAISWLFLAKNLYFAGVSFFVCAIGMYELLKMYKFNWLAIVSTVLLFIAIILSLYILPYYTGSLVRIIAILVWCFVVPGVLILQPKHFAKIIIALVALALFFLAFYAFVAIHTAFGPWILLSIMAIAWVADTGAYFVGRAFGRHKLAPSISPGKSIEGAFGGFVLVVVYLFTLKHLYSIPYLYSNFALCEFAIIITIVSIMGDLFESWLKRVSGVKDSSNILPGHGGVFDRIDSLIAVVAVAYAMLYNLF